MKPAVLQVVETLEHGGAERVVVGLANSLAPASRSAICCVKRRGELVGELDPRVDCFLFDKGEGNDANVPFKLARLVRRDRFEVVHTHSWGVFLEGALAAWMTGARHVHTAHGPYLKHGSGLVQRAKARLRRSLERLAARRCHRLVGVSESIATDMREVMRLPTDRVTTVHNGIDSSRGVSTLAAPFTNVSGPRLITVGRLDAIKQQELMLEALATLRDDFPGARLVIVGDGPERQRLERRASELRLESMVSFLGFRNDVAQLLADADVFLLSSRYEGISIALLEAMRAGLPVIATCVGGVPETVVDGESALLFEAGDTVGLASAIERLSTSPALAAKLVAGGRDRVRDHFSAEAMVGCYGRIYDDSGPVDGSRRFADRRTAAAGLRILYHHRTQGRGAESVHIGSIVRALEAMGHHVTIAGPPAVDARATEGMAPVDKSSVGTRGIGSLWKWVSRHLPAPLFELAEIGYNLVAWWRLRKILSAQRYDLIYERYAFYLIAGAWMARRRGIRFVLEANEVNGIEQRARLQVFPRLCGCFERFLFVRCDAILPVNSYLARLIEQRGADKARVRVVPNAIDPQLLQSSPRRPDLLTRYGLHGRTVVGFAGWFDHWDRLDMLLHAVHRLRPAYPGLAALLIGDGPMAEQLRAKARELGLENDVVVTGAVPRTEVHDHLALLDVAVLPHSNIFGSPIVLFELMARRVPVVAPRLPGIQDVLEDDVSVLLFDPLDESALTQTVDRMLSAPFLRRRLASVAYDQLARRHTWHHNAQRILVAAGLAQEAHQLSEARRAS